MVKEKRREDEDENNATDRRRQHGAGGTVGNCFRLPPTAPNSSPLLPSFPFQVHPRLVLDYNTNHAQLPVLRSAKARAVLRSLYTRRVRRIACTHTQSKHTRTPLLHNLTHSPASLSTVNVPPKSRPRSSRRKHEHRHYLTASPGSPVGTVGASCDPKSRPLSNEWRCCAHSFRQTRTR